VIGVGRARLTTRAIIAHSHVPAAESAPVVDDADVLERDAPRRDRRPLGTERRMGSRTSPGQASIELDPKGGAMWSWLVVAVLYALGMGFFSLLGGLGGAAEAFQKWGSKTGSERSRRSPASS
jgi:hypothetical protein